MSQHQAITVGSFSCPLYPHGSHLEKAGAHHKPIHQCSAKRQSPKMSLYPIICHPPASRNAGTLCRRANASQLHGNCMIELSYGQILSFLGWTWPAVKQHRCLGHPGPELTGQHLTDFTPKLSIYKGKCLSQCLSRPFI